MARPCLCGAPDCPSCGPAQGYRKCKLHNEWGCGDCEGFALEHDRQLPETEEELETYLMNQNQEKD